MDAMHELAQERNQLREQLAAERARAESMSIALTNANKACEKIAADRDRLRAAGRALLACPHIAERDMEPAWAEPETEKAIAEMRAALEAK